jgi:membrane-associated phospholipid phosphatase
MQLPKFVGAIAVLVATALPTIGASAQSAVNLDALKGLSPVSALENTIAGKAALKGNLLVTGAIQDGSGRQPTLLPFREQQQQSLRDAFITWGNAFELADALGSKLGGVYQSLTPYTSVDDGKTSQFASLSPAVANLIAYAIVTIDSDAGSGKYFFGNATTDGKNPVSAEASAILKSANGVTDIFGVAYGLPAGGKGADAYGDSRPFQTEPEVLTFKGKDFFGVPSDNIVYLHGPTQDLTDNPSYPSGHTTYGYTEALLLALLVPERYPQMVVRAAEYGNDRIILGAHYAMDVLGGRTLAAYDLAQLLANKPGYVGVERRGIQIGDFRQALATARADVSAALKDGCHEPVTVCAKQDRSRFARPANNLAFYETTQTYGLPAVFPGAARKVEDVGALAPEAGYLLTAAFPYLTLRQADAILTATEGPGGGFLDNGSAFGVYSRLDLYRAAQWAIALAPGGANRHFLGKPKRF